MKTSQKIIQYIKQNNKATGSELVDFLDISGRAVRKQLKNLLESNILTKDGRPPKVFYSLNNIKKSDISSLDGKFQIIANQYLDVDIKIKKIINDYYVIITPQGKKIEGFDGFVYWCQKNNLNVKKTASEYVSTIKKYNKYKKRGLINGLVKMKNTFKNVYLNKVFYLDFYSIERFGKTKTGQFLLYSKQSGNKKIIKEIIKEIKPKIELLIKREKIDAIGFIPWTVKREVQFMKELEKGLYFSLKNIKIDKIKTEIIVPQKTLSKLNDRVENAKNTIVVTERGSYNNILLIDDAIGSGATLNETAKQLKDSKVAKKVIGLAITGSFKGFDIISEV